MKHTTAVGVCFAAHIPIRREACSIRCKLRAFQVLFTCTTLSSAETGMKMAINIGLDIGAISLKLAALGTAADRPALDSPLRRQSRIPHERGWVAGRWCFPHYRRIAGSPIQSTYDLLHEFYASVPETRIEGIRVTGSGSRTIAKVLGLFFENEFKAIARMMGTFYPHVRTVFEIGGESSKYIRLEGGEHRRLRSVGRMRGRHRLVPRPAGAAHAVFGRRGGRASSARASCAARIAGRCSVFAKSDMIHAQQKGYSPAEILRGLCDAVARNFKSSIVKGRPAEAPVALIGAVSQNAGVTRAIREAFGLAAEDLFVPAELRLVRRDRDRHPGSRRAAQALDPGDPPPAPARRRDRTRRTRTPLSTEHVVQLRDRVSGLRAAARTMRPIPAYLGLDIGSVSTNVVVIDDMGAVVHDIYLRTAGRPIEAVQQGLAEVGAPVGQPPRHPRRRHDWLGP